MHQADSTGQTLREYVWVEDMPLLIVSDVNTATPVFYFVHPDHLNRPLRMTNGSKAVVWNAVYLPFGGVVSINGPASNNLRFPGQYFLIEDGLHYNWYRHYDSTLGRYLQADPSTAVQPTTAISNSIASPLLQRGEISGSSVLTQTSILSNINEENIGAELPEFTDGPSIYAYVRSTPLMRADPKGLFSGPFTPVPRPGGAQQCSLIVPGCEQANQMCIKRGFSSLDCYKSWRMCIQGFGTIFPGGIGVYSGPYGRL